MSCHSNEVTIEKCFSDLTDPRRRKVTYPLINIVTIAICAVICRADDFVAIAAFGRSRRDWLSRFLDLSAGIPSHDRFRPNRRVRVLRGSLRLDQIRQVC